MLRKRRFQMVDISVTAANQTVQQDTELDKNFKKVKALQVLFSNVNAVQGGTFSDGGLLIQDKVVFDPGFQLKMLWSNHNGVGVKERWYPMDDPAAGARLKFTFKDNGGFAAVGAAYTVTLVLELSNLD